MELSNFKLIETKGNSALNKEFFAEVDVATRGIFFWKVIVERKKIRRKFGCYYHVVYIGKLSPLYQSENLARAWTAQTGQET